MRNKYFRNFERRFWDKVNVSKDCWLWIGGKSGNYGAIYYKGKLLHANRASWLIEHGRLPKLFVLHKCDVKLCIRPSHLFLGTKSDNAIDAVKKGIIMGRPHYGSDNGNSKFTEVQVAAIKRDSRDGLTRKEIICKYKLTSGIGPILRGETWRHIS